MVENRERDERTAQKLAALGYRLVVIWECEMTQKESVAAISRVHDALGNQTESLAPHTFVTVENLTAWGG
jgi:G:T-mismatch repair DNA endonuclease (very short patch repair protein)